MQYHGFGSCDGVSDSFLCCVRLASPIFGVRIVGNKQYGQGSRIDLWTICLFGLDAIQVQSLSKGFKTLGTLNLGIVGFHLVESFVCMAGNKCS